ncbi:MAG: type II secretion system protein GspE, partial [Chitinivibrionales bacterium]|nr:type II secretion system protein GspE [Chitinivibrionales bacterium]MBD3396579.1 type II secretion system protein GspE [Chitinivibrionales bacterium]
MNDTEMNRPGAAAAVNEDALAAALDSFAGSGEGLAQHLASALSLTISETCRVLARTFSLSFVETISDAAVGELLRELPPEVFHKTGSLPLHAGEATVGVATADPFDLDTLMQVELATGLVCEPVLTTPQELARAREAVGKGASAIRQSAGSIVREYEKAQQRDEAAMTLDEIKKRTESEPVVKMVNLVFDQAIANRASDIHIEPSVGDAAVRLRVDGMLRGHMDVSKWMFPAVTSRIKILADLDIAEKRVPQDGRIRYARGGEEFDFRVSTLPTHHGEKTVIRILKHDHALLDIANVGMGALEQRQLLELIEKPQGMVFVTGPTGSGKSSTLFACLNRIRHKAINITTIENPIEYKLEGINQVQINEKAGVSFAAALRSILRQDPDVILVGEIRDGETAQIAIQASQTGHLVFSTLHTNDAVSAITRLRDLGVPGFMVSSALLAVVAQRLVRTLCTGCRKRVPFPEKLVERWANVLGAEPPAQAFAAVGCDACGNSGFRGRTGIFEVIAVNDHVRALVGENASEATLRKELRRLGVRTMIENGIAKIEHGVTTPEELLRVVMVDDVAR